jgi:hypothetical protein
MSHGLAEVAPIAYLVSSSDGLEGPWTIDIVSSVSVEKE